MTSTNDLIFFPMIASSPSLAEAARRLNVTPPAVTQRMRAFEAKLGVNLVERTLACASVALQSIAFFGRCRFQDKPANFNVG